MISPPVHIRLYREQNKPETIDDFIAVYDLQALLGSADPTITCREDSGCYFRGSKGCGFHYDANRPPGQPVTTCAIIFKDPTKPAIFILRSEYERTLSG